MFDLTGLFALGEGLARQAISTSSTRIAVGTVAKMVDPETVTEVETFTEKWSSGAIVTPVGNTAVTAAPGLDLRLTDWRVLTYPEQTPPEPQQIIRVTASRDPNQVGREAVVLGHTVTSAGAVLTIFARPR